MVQTRYEKGLKTLIKITASSGSAVVEGLKDIAPDLADWIINFSYGDVLSRTKLDLRSRQLATIAALTAMGTATPQLKVHIKGALNVGCRKEEIIEVILQMAVFAGFPAAINGINASREVFENEELS
ncbi:MAG: carboxymuconolactone decarboxylase family protein [Desulfosarcina sp.]|nr:carboxymuconolactone decarboxylase family protein [Desulfobacterales bacterium]